MSKTTQPPQMPEIQNVPTWDKDAKIELFGYEWEVIYNTIMSIQILQQVSQGVMSRNVLNGTIAMDFKKLDAKSLNYLDMTDEEKEPYKKDFAKMISAMKEQQESIQKGKEQAVPVLEEKVDSVEPIEEVGVTNGPIQEGGKVVSMVSN